MALPPDVPALPDSTTPKGSGREITKRFRQAVAIAHGVGYLLSANALMEYVYEHGLPPREERERILAERLAEELDEGDNTSSVTRTSQ